MDNSNRQVSDPKFLHIPYEARWEFLKDTIVRLYIDENETLSSLAQRMKTEYSFAAQ